MCLKQKSVSFLHKNIVNFYVTYELHAWSKNLNADFTLGNCLFGAIKLPKNADPDKYKDRGYDIRFDSSLRFLWTDGSEGKNVISGVDNGYSAHIHDKNKNILVLGGGPRKGLDNATITIQ